MDLEAPRPPATRVVVVEDHTLFAQALALALTLAGHQVFQEIVDDDRTAANLLAAVTHKRPDVVLLDLDLGPYIDGRRLIAPLAAAGFAVVVLTATANQHKWGEALAHGARTVLWKGESLATIRATVQRTAVGLGVIDPGKREAMMSLWYALGRREVAGREQLHQLTHREADVLGRLAQGLSAREIAQLNVVSDATVRTQVKSILRKLGVSSQLAAVALARDAGWHGPDDTSHRS